MSAFASALWLGSRLVRPTTAQLAQIANRDPAYYDVNLENVLRNMGYFTIPLGIATAINANTKTSLGLVARIPFKVVAVELGCESGAGSAVTCTIEKAPAATPSTFATMLTSAVVDVLTAVGTFQAGVVLNGAEDVAVGDVLRLSCTGTGSGAVVGAAAILHAFRL